jgi:hypothetical protein
VLPGGTVLTPKPTPAGKLPLDWVTTYPNQFVEDGKISYFVYGLPETDDPSELNYAGLRMTQRNYLALIQTYGGVLVDRIVAGNQNQVLIFQVTRRTPVGDLKYKIDQTHIVLTGSGFAVNSPLAVYYHNKLVGAGSSNAQGEATLSVQYPARTRKPWQFVVRDPQGYYAAVGGLASPAITAERASSGYGITGTGFAPGAKVTVTYGKTKIGQETVSAQGTVELVIKGFPHLGPRYRLRLADSLGQFASVDHLTTAKPRHPTKQ